MKTEIQKKHDGKTKLFSCSGCSCVWWFFRCYTRVCPKRVVVFDCCVFDVWRLDVSEKKPRGFYVFNYFASFSISGQKNRLFEKPIGWRTESSCIYLGFFPNFICLHKVRLVPLLDFIFTIWIHAGGQSFESFWNSWQSLNVLDRNSFVRKFAFHVRHTTRNNNSNSTWYAAQKIVSL